MKKLIQRFMPDIAAGLIAALMFVFIPLGIWELQQTLTDYRESVCVCEHCGSEYVKEVR